MTILAFTLASSLPAGSCDQAVSHAARMACAAAQLSDADQRLDDAWRLYRRTMQQAADRTPDGGTYAPSTKQAERRSAERYLKAVDHSRFQFRAFRNAHCFGEGFSARGGSGSDDPIVVCKIKLDDMQTARLTALTKAIR